MANKPLKYILDNLDTIKINKNDGELSEVLKDKDTLKQLIEHLNAEMFKNAEEMKSIECKIRKLLDIIGELQKLYQPYYTLNDKDIEIITENDTIDDIMNEPAEDKLSDLDIPDDIIEEKTEVKPKGKAVKKPAAKTVTKKAPVKKTTKVTLEPEEIVTPTPKKTAVKTKTKVVAETSAPAPVKKAPVKKTPVKKTPVKTKVDSDSEGDKYVSD